MTVTDARLGAELGNYRIEEFLGRGGMGVVYRAEHRYLGRRVALKLLAPELAENESFRERFVRESRLAAAIDHPNVIPIYEACEVDGSYFIAMRYVDGVDLRAILIQESPLTLERSLSILTQVGGGLDAAHAQGLVHRDVKPGNVLTVGGSDHCYLTDFGLTKAISSNSGFTATGQFVGTTDYVAPEQIEGREIDRRTDVYSLACVFYECLTGAPPYRRENDMAVLWAHVHEPPPRVTDARRDLPPELDAVIAAAMAKSKDERYPSCSAFAAAARSALEVGTGRTFVPPVAPALMPPPPTLGNGAAPQPRPFSNAYTVAENGAFPPYAQPAAYAALGYTVADPPPRRQKPITAIALIVAALVLAAGGTAAALIATQRKGEHRVVTATNAAAPVPAPGQAPPAPTNSDTSSTPAPQPQQTTPTHSSPAPTPSSPAPTPGSGGDGSAAVQTVDEHWSAINDHRFSDAYSLFSSHEQATQAGGESGWIASHKQEQIVSATGSFSLIDQSGDQATVGVDSLQTDDLANGCQTWTGKYSIVRLGGQWLIDHADLSASPC